MTTPATQADANPSSVDATPEQVVTLADLVVQLSAIRTVLREAHFALDDSEDLSHLDEPVHAVPLNNVMRLHRALKACERFAPEDAVWEGPGPLVTQIIEQLGHHLTHREALERIADPLTVMRRDAEAIGRRLEGRVAYALSNDPNYLKEIARKALASEGNTK